MEYSLPLQYVDDPTHRTECPRTYIDRYPYSTPTGHPKSIGKRWKPTDGELTAIAAATVWVAINPA